VARGTKLFQAPGSPLIQGRSRTQRPWWQPYAAAVVIGLAWPLVALVPGALGAYESAPQIATIASDLVKAWVGSLPVLVPSVLAGAGVGMLVSGVWGIRHRWVPAAVCAVGGWYLALLIMALIG